MDGPDFHPVDPTLALSAAPGPAEAVPPAFRLLRSSKEEDEPILDIGLSPCVANEPEKVCELPCLSKLLLKFPDLRSPDPENDATRELLLNNTGSTIIVSEVDPTSAISPSSILSDKDHNNR